MTILTASSNTGSESGSQTVAVSGTCEVDGTIVKIGPRQCSGVFEVPATRSVLASTAEIFIATNESAYDGSTNRFGSSAGDSFRATTHDGRRYQ
jgi:hypothetical protein